MRYTILLRSYVMITVDASDEVAARRLAVGYRRRHSHGRVGKHGQCILLPGEPRVIDEMIVPAAKQEKKLTAEGRGEDAEEREDRKVFADGKSAAAG